jgi:hypothetical protein
MWAWTREGSDDAFLALDRNGNGRIEDGTELFGDGSVQIASATPNGFMALGYFDLPEQGGDGDGKITPSDAVWRQLRLWRDADHDGYSAAYELMSLEHYGIREISLSYNARPSAKTDEHGNEFRYSSTIVADAPMTQIVSDVWLTQTTVPIGDAPVGRTQRDYTTWTCWSWVYALTEASPHVACATQSVWGDPIVTTPFGQIARLIARHSGALSITSAAENATDMVINAMNDEPGPCVPIAYPVPDPFRDPPYNKVGGGPNPSSTNSSYVRVQCTGQTVHQGGC